MIGNSSHQVTVADLACVFDAVDGYGSTFLRVCRKSLPDLWMLFVKGGRS